MRLALVIALLVETSGCSAVFLQTAPHDPPTSTPPPCDLDSYYPAADIAVWGIGLIATLVTTAGLSVDLFGGSDRLTRNEAIGLSAAAGVELAYGLSGVYGMHQTRRCQRLHRRAVDPDSSPRGD